MVEGTSGVFRAFFAGRPRWHSGEKSTGQFRKCRRPQRRRFDPWVGKIPWRKTWETTSAFLPGKFHGQRSLAGYSPKGSQRVKHDEKLSTHAHGH